ncbi:MAG TPA: helix-turn-helix domain-containing protein [Ktedonobacterales bacterium]|nr:helix-turn-helix domain-containing protein [Ktedonobacterales bacterium]
MASKTTEASAPAVAAQLYTVPEAARVLRLSTSKTWALACSGVLGSCKIGRSRRISAAAIARFIERMQQEEAEAQGAA